MVNADSNTAPGFAFHRTDRYVKLLLPFATIAEIDAQTERLELAAAAEKAALAAAEKAQKEAPKPKSVFPPTKSIRPGPRDIEIFSEASIETLLDNFDAMDNASQRAGAKVHSSLTTDRGRYRTVPAINRRNVLSLAAQFENMAEPIGHLVKEIDLMAHLPHADFHLTPILLARRAGHRQDGICRRTRQSLGTAV